MTTITSKGMTLHYTIGTVVTGPVSVGDVVEDFRGDKFIIQGGTAPRELGKSGYVYVTEPGAVHEHSYYPTVFGLKWVEAS